MNDTIKSTHERHTAATQEVHEAIEAYRAASKTMAEAEQRLNKARDQYRRTTDEVMRGLPGQSLSGQDLGGLVRQYKQYEERRGVPPKELPPAIGWPLPPNPVSLSQS